MTGAPPLSSIVFNFPSAKNPSEPPLGDQKGKNASAVPGSARASSEFVGRTHRVCLPSLAAVNAIALPSGESTGGPAVSSFRRKRLFGGGSITVRTLGAAGWEWGIRNPAPAPSNKAATKPAAQPTELGVLVAAVVPANGRSAAIRSSSSF